VLAGASLSLANGEYQRDQGIKVNLQDKVEVRGEGRGEVWHEEWHGE
jgi:hypothetical protein